MFPTNHPQYPARITTKDPFYYKNVPYWFVSHLFALCLLGVTCKRRRSR